MDWSMSDRWFLNNPALPSRRDVRVDPFRHVIIDHALPPQHHQAICAAFSVLQRQGLSERFVTERLARFPGYDAYCWIFGSDAPAPLRLFVGSPLRDYCAQLFGLELSDEVVAEFHHHLPGSRSDSWHDDYNLAYFAPAAQHGMNPWHFQCNYMDGSGLPAGQALTRYRALTLIYYFGADNWRPGMGGETELGAERGVSVECRVAVAPRPNRLLVFECSPGSYHRFTSNIGFIRNSVILWYHGYGADALRRYGQAPRGWSAGDIAGGRRDDQGLPIDDYIPPQTFTDG
jgi:hypothetical protein